MPALSAIRDQLQPFLDAAQHVVFFSGAGCSAESGVPTFRGPDGLWRNHRPEDLATPRAFSRDPNLVWEWYNWRRGLIARCQPNPAHIVAARLADRFNTATVITQNVDALHQLAGAADVIELHGSIWELRCTGCGASRIDRTADLDPLPPVCESCGSLFRPGVVWFGESLPMDALQRTQAAMERCDLLFVVGTSAVVYPAAQFPAVAKQNGAFVVEINPDATPMTRDVDLAIPEKAGVALAALFPEFLEA